MSTLPGLASKGEKSKQKFQSLDINSLYRVSRGENLEKQQQKSPFTYKHGMQSLGKVPNARRAPANLPSLKSEHSGNDASVPLVPPGGPGWGKQETTSSTSTSTPTTSTQTSSSPVTPTPQLSSHQANIALPVTTTIPPQPIKHVTPSATPATTDKSWSAVMSGPDLTQPPLYQSPQFQHEFPSLSVGDGGGQVRAGSEVQYAPGLSLRPQTEGSWIQGGSRPGVDPAGPPRSNSVPLGAPPQLAAQVGLPQQQLPPQFRAVMPTFMYKGNFVPSGNGAPNQNPPQMNGRNRTDNRPSPRMVDPEEITPRPIIKEEELIRMDEINKDMGWTCQDDVDYNQKLAFSDDESSNDKSSRREAKSFQTKEPEKFEPHQNDSQRNWNNSNLSQTGRHRSSDEELWKQRRNQHNKDLELTVQRAKQRKEEEEKRFNEATKQGAAKKLMELEEKMSKRNRDEEGAGTINPSIVPPKPIVPADIPLPDFQREKERDRERDSRSRTPIEIDDKSLNNTSTVSNRGSENSFRQMTQIEGKNFPNRKHVKGSERDRERDQNGPSFSRQFQVPPRFQKQRIGSNTSVQNHMNLSSTGFDNRWQQDAQHLTKTRQDSPTNVRDLDDERRDYKRQPSIDNEDSSHRSTHRPHAESGHKLVENRFVDEPQDYRYQDYDYSRRYKEEDKWHKEKEKDKVDDWHNDRRDKFKEEKERHHERPQRPDSRDSRASRDSRQSRESARDSEPRDHIGSWAESTFEPSYEEKRREHGREDRRTVPGPITKERMEAEEMRNERRGLTQLKRGQIPEKKVEMKDEKIPEESQSNADSMKLQETNVDSGPKAWADAVSPNTVYPDSGKFIDTFEKPIKGGLNVDAKQDIESKKSDKSDSEYSKDKDDKRGRNRYYSQNKGWVSNDYPKSGWAKRSNRGSRTGGLQRDFHGTDSEGSIDDFRGEDRKSLKADKKFFKDEKNKEIKNERSNTLDRGNKSDRQDSSKRDTYVPRGEPSRHGRGGGNFRGRGGLSKRIDGYGPPPAKSPFGGHHEEKEKKLSSDENFADVLTSEDRAKQNQQALSAGIIGNIRKETNQRFDDKLKSRKLDNNRRGKSKTKGDSSKRDDENVDSNSDNSDDRSRKSQTNKTNVPARTSLTQSRRGVPPPRLSSDKKPYRSEGQNLIPRQNSSGALRSSNSLKKDEKPVDQTNLSNTIVDTSIKNKTEIDLPTEEGEEKVSSHGDSDGFQEVKSKKTVKERQKSLDEKPTTSNKSVPKELNKTKSKSSGTTNSQLLTQQQIQNIPPLMGTPINPPPVLPQTNKNQFERMRQNKLAPRFAKQRENNRLQKQQMQQQTICDVTEMTKVNQNINVYAIKDQAGVVTSSLSNAWDKSLGTQLRNIDSDVLGVGGDASKSIDHVQATSQSSSPNNDKIIGKTGQISDKAIFDATNAPVNTLIFENTNFKSGPGSRNGRSENKTRPKLEEGTIESNSVVGGFNKPIVDLLCKNDKQSDSTIQIPLPFKEDNADIKLDFFESDLSHLTDDKSSKNLCMPRSMHAMPTGNNTTISTADALNFKIQSVKKVWETPSEHNVGQEDANSCFPSSFTSDPNALDPNSFVKGNDSPDDNHEGYSPSPNQVVSNSTTNVCKVKPTQQVSGGGGQAVLNSTSHPHSGIMGPSLMNPLSPPPIQPVIGTGVNLGQPPQQYTANQHISYQPSLSGSNQYGGISAIPSPPTVMYNSTQQIQQTAGLYGPFQIDQSGVLGGQGRSQYSQYPNHYSLGQTGSSPYSTQSVYLQTQPHPPPTAQAPPDIYQNLSNYRLSATAPFGQNQQLNNPTTVLISSTSNSLMSASVKPSSQQISAIGTKAGGVGQAYQQQSQQSQQVYMAYEPALQPSYLPGAAGVMQRGPTGPVQNNVMPGLQPSSSYYSGSTGQTGYFQQPGSSAIQSAAQLQQHQAGYGLQGFGTHNQSHTNAGLQSFNSHFFNSQLAAAINAQQYRSGLPTQYMKSVGNQPLGDQGGRSQQLKSPGSLEVTSSVFNSGSQISSPKLRQNCKQPPPQPSPTAQHKYNLYPGVGNQQSGNMQRYPPPIQRPVNFQQNLGSVQQNTNSQKHRPNNPNNKTSNRQYYQNNSISSQNDKIDDGKLNEGSLSSGNSTNSSVANKAVIGSNVTPAVNASTEIAKDAINIEETSALKD